MMLGFDDHYAMFDVTPVDNQFIQEYLPSAKGDYVRVYLYGLMRCYHPEESLSAETMARELKMTEDEVIQAYRYWERRGLVRRISDHPLQYRYISLRENLADPAPMLDPAYEAFADSLYSVFSHGRQLHGQEIQNCYEWVEELKLPAEAVIMLLRHLEHQKGKNFTMASAEQLAMQMASEGVQTLEDAEAFLSRDQEIYQGTRKILRRLGKRNAPSEDQLALYRKWTREWGFTHEAVEQACAETAKGDPNMGYLDGVLRKIHQRAEGGEIDESSILLDRKRREALRGVLDALGQGTVNGSTLAWHERLLAAYPNELIRLAVRECARTQGKPEDVEKMLASWNRKGLKTPEDAEQYIAEFRAQSEVLRELRRKWGLGTRMGEKDRALLSTWEKELGFDKKMILFTANYAAGSERPMAYLDKVLREYAQKGIRTPEEAEREHETHLKTVIAAGAANGNRSGQDSRLPAQRYSQRDYSEEMETPEEMWARLNGGEIPHA